MHSGVRSAVAAITKLSIFAHLHYSFAVRPSHLRGPIATRWASCSVLPMATRTRQSSLPYGIHRILFPSFDREQGMQLDIVPFYCLQIPIHILVLSSSAQSKRTQTQTETKRRRVGKGSAAMDKLSDPLPLRKQRNRQTAKRQFRTSQELTKRLVSSVKAPRAPN